MAIKKKRQQSPKERKLSLIALPFMIVGVICSILTATGMGIIVWLIIALICLTIVIVLAVKMMKEHKQWIAEGNPEYRYYDTETGQEVDEHGNPLTGQPVPQAKPQSTLASKQVGEDNQPEPAFEGEEKPAPQKQPETIRGADLTIFGKLLPAAGLGLLALAFLLRTIMFIRELVPYAKNGGTFWGSYILYAIRIIGPAILLAISVVALVKFFVNKQTINRGYKAMLNLAVWYAVLNIVGLIYVISSLGVLIYDFVDLAIKNSGVSDIFVEMLIDNIIIDVFYIAFAIALIIFTKIALKNNVDSMKNKVFAMLPFGIIVLTEILFMIITGVTMPEGYSAPGYFVTAVIILLGAGSLGAIPFLVKFEKDDASNLIATSAIATAPVAAAPVYQEPKEPQDLQEPKEVKPNKKNDGDPEVKSSKKGLIIILIAVIAFVLVGGGVTTAILLVNKNNREKGPNDDENSYVIPPSSSSSKSSSPLSSRSSSSPRPSSSSSEPSSSSSSTETYEAYKVINDLCKSIFGRSNFQEFYPEDYDFWKDGSVYYSWVGYAEEYTSESYLSFAVTNIRDNYLPDYLRAYDTLKTVTWSDGANGYIQHFITSDNRVYVELGSFIASDDSSSQLICQISVQNL